MYAIGNIVVDCEMYIFSNLYTYITIYQHNGMSYLKKKLLQVSPAAPPPPFPKFWNL